MKKKPNRKNSGNKTRKPSQQPASPENQPEEKGKETWSDVYTVGRPLKTDFGQGRSAGGKGKRKSPEVQSLEDTVNSSQLMSSKDFIACYQAARKVISPDESTQENSSAPPKRKRRSKAKTPEHNVGSEPGDRGSTVGLRVIGGKYRGTKLKYSGDNRVRPMKDRVREAVFNLIGTDAQGRHVLDLFAGTGALAFEALSRGASSATLVEIHFPTARITKDNIALLESVDSELKTKISLITTDVFFWGRTLSERFQTEEVLRRDLPWLVFCSPPYDFYVDRQDELLLLIDQVKAVAPQDSLFVIEADERFDFALLDEEIPKRKRRSYPPAEVALFSTK